MKVRIKTWEQMVKEFGYVSDIGGIDTDLIDVKCCFTSSMEEELPLDRVIDIWEYRGEVGIYESSCGLISLDMIEEILTNYFILEVTRTNGVNCYIEKYKFSDMMCAREAGAAMSYAENVVVEVYPEK